MSLPKNSIIKFVLILTICFSNVDGNDWVKCPLGKEFNDGCNTCYCEPEDNGYVCTEIACEGVYDVCPKGFLNVDNLGNICQCDPSTGAKSCTTLRTT